jgi:T4-like virus tail tube protein gp19
VSNGDAGVARNVSITLLAEDRSPVLMWRLLHAMPVAIHYGPLKACDGSVAVEWVELAVQQMVVE